MSGAGGMMNEMVGRIQGQLPSNQQFFGPQTQPGYQPSPWHGQGMFNQMAYGLSGLGGGNYPGVGYGPQNPMGYQPAPAPNPFNAGFGQGGGPRYGQGGWPNWGGGQFGSMSGRDYAGGFRGGMPGSMGFGGGSGMHTWQQGMPYMGRQWVQPPQASQATMMGPGFRMQNEQRMPFRPMSGIPGYQPFGRFGGGGGYMPTRMY